MFHCGIRLPAAVGLGARNPKTSEVSFPLQGSSATRAVREFVGDVPMAAGTNGCALE